jgi:hypothetical protein
VFWILDELFNAGVFVNDIELQPDYLSIENIKADYSPEFGTLTLRRIDEYKFELKDNINSRTSFCLDPFGCILASKILRKGKDVQFLVRFSLPEELQNIPIEVYMLVNEVKGYVNFEQNDSVITLHFKTIAKQE